MEQIYRRFFSLLQNEKVKSVHIFLQRWLKCILMTCVVCIPLTLLACHIADRAENDNRMYQAWYRYTLYAQDIIADVERGAPDYEYENGYDALREQIGALNVQEWYTPYYSTEDNQKALFFMYSAHVMLLRCLPRTFQEGLTDTEGFLLMKRYVNIVESALKKTDSYVDFANSFINNRDVSDWLYDFNEFEESLKEKQMANIPEQEKETAIT